MIREMLKQKKRGRNCLAFTVFLITMTFAAPKDTIKEFFGEQPIQMDNLNKNEKSNHKWIHENHSRYKIVTINENALVSDTVNLSLSLFNGNKIEALFTCKKDARGNPLWKNITQSDVDKTKSKSNKINATFGKHKGVFWGSIFYNGEQFSLQQISGNEYALMEIDVTKQLPDAPAIIVDNNGGAR